jgi:hypothetical protein
MSKVHGEQVAKLVRFHNEERAARSTKFPGTISDQRAERERVRKSRSANSYDEDAGYSDSYGGDSSSSERVTVRTHRRERSIERNTPYISHRENRYPHMPHRSRSRERDIESLPVRRMRSRSRSREKVRTPLVARRERSPSPLRERGRVRPLWRHERSLERNPVREPANVTERKVQATVKRKKDKPEPIGSFGTTKKKEDKPSNGFALWGSSWKSSNKTKNREPTTSRET